MFFFCLNHTLCEVPSPEAREVVFDARALGLTINTTTSEAEGELTEYSV